MCIFPFELFSFYEKVPYALDHTCFDLKYFTALHPYTQIIFFYWFLLVDIQNYANKINGSLTKISLQICYKDIKRLKHRHFSGSYQRNRMPSAKHLWQTSFFRLWLRASWKDSRGERVRSNLKLKTMTTCFTHGIFSIITGQATCTDKSILRNIVFWYYNKNPSQTFLQGLFHSLKLQEITSDGVAF